MRQMLTPSLWLTFSHQCDGMLPCSHCSIDDDSAKGEPCNYVVHSQVAKGEMKTTIDDLQERDRISSVVFQALASPTQAPSILQSLQDGEDLSTIAYGIEAVVSPSATVSSPPAQRRSSTCDACKFRRQYCDGTKPACRTCQTRRLSCKYTNTPASVVVEPIPLIDTSSNPQGNLGDQRSRRLSSTDTVRSRLSTVNVYYCGCHARFLLEYRA